MKKINAFINLEQFLKKNIPEELLIWGDKAIIKHKYGLISMGITKHENIREEFNIGNEMIIFGDSGGFQLITGSNTKVDPMKTLYKYKTNEVDWASIFDVPLVSIADGKLIPVLSKEKTVKYAELTCKYSRKMLDRSTGLDIKYYNVIHGNYYEQIGIWFSIVNKLELPRFAINTRFGLKNIALKVAYLIENDIKDVFFFGTASLDNILFMLSIRDYFDVMSLDTTNFNIMSFNREKLVSNQFSKILIVYRDANEVVEIKGDDNPINADEFEEFCICPICSRFSDKKLWFSNLAPYLLVNHNLYIFFQDLKTLEFLSRFKNFKKYRVKIANDPNTLENMIKFIDCVHKVGIDDAYERYEVHFSEFKSKLPKKVEYQSIDGFI